MFRLLVPRLAGMRYKEAERVEGNAQKSVSGCTEALLRRESAWSGKHAIQAIVMASLCREI